MESVARRRGGWGKKRREASEAAERLAREASATSRDAETREKTLNSEMARLATEADARRRELEVERARRGAEEKVRLPAKRAVRRRL